MAGNLWNQRLLGRTRWKIVVLLRTQPRSTKELASTLDVTENAVRPHLATLERDGLVQQKGSRQSGGKPAFVFELTAHAENLFPKAYGLILKTLLDELQTRHPEDHIESVMLSVAKRLSSLFPRPIGSVEDRLKRAQDVIEELGGYAEWQTQNGERVLQGYSCPVAQTVNGHPESCLLAQTLLSEVCGLPLVETCDKGDPPRCSFRLAVNRLI